MTLKQRFAVLLLTALAGTMPSLADTVGFTYLNPQDGNCNDLDAFVTSGSTSCRTYAMCVNINPNTGYSYTADVTVSAWVSQCNNWYNLQSSTWVSDPGWRISGTGKVTDAWTGLVVVRIDPWASCGGNQSLDGTVSKSPC